MRSCGSSSQCLLRCPLRWFTVRPFKRTKANHAKPKRRFSNGATSTCYQEEAMQGLPRGRVKPVLRKNHPRGKAVTVLNGLQGKWRHATWLLHGNANEVLVSILTSGLAISIGSCWKLMSYSLSKSKGERTWALPALVIHWHGGSIYWIGLGTEFRLIQAIIRTAPPAFVLRFRHIWPTPQNRTVQPQRLLEV